MASSSTIGYFWQSVFVHSDVNRDIEYESDGMQFPHFLCCARSRQKHSTVPKGLGSYPGGRDERAARMGQVSSRQRHCYCLWLFSLDLRLVLPMSPYSSLSRRLSQNPSLKHSILRSRASSIQRSFPTTPQESSPVPPSRSDGEVGGPHSAALAPVCKFLDGYYPNDL